MIDIEGKEHLLDAIFEYCKDIITVKDLDLKYIAYNKAFLSTDRRLLNISYISTFSNQALSTSQI